MSGAACRIAADRDDGFAAEPRLHVLLVLKTSDGGLWALPHIDELRARGHEMTVLLPAEQGRLRAALSERGVTVVDSAFNFEFRPWPAALLGLAGLRRQIRDVAPDVIHYHLYASALAARFASLGCGIPRVHMVAGPLFLESQLIRGAERWLVLLDTVTIGGSERTSQLYRALGRKVSRTPVIPYGVDTSRFRPPGSHARDQLRAKLGIEEGTFVVIMVAFVYSPKQRVHAGRGIKGHDVLLQAWARFHAEHAESHLFLIGSGFDEAGERHRRDLADRFDVENPRAGVTWISTTSDVRPYYSAADLSVSPSLSDNHGAALEAGSMGVPSIVSDAGALPETVDRRSGWVVRRDDVAALALALRAAQAEDGRNELRGRGACARQFVRERFDSTRLAAAVADVIEQAAANHPTGEIARRRRVLSLFTEARFGTDAAGAWAAPDTATGPEAWARYGQQGGLRLVARATRDPASATVTLPATIEIVPLPYYVGGRELVREMVPLLAAVGRAVAAADTIVLRVPGVVGSLAAPMCRLARRRYAVEVVGDPADVLASGAVGPAGRLLAPAARAYTRWVVRGAAASRFVTREALQRRYPPHRRTPSTAISNVRLGPGSILATPRHWLPEPFRIVTIGSQEMHYKGHDVLLRAVRELVDTGFDVTATVVGGGRLHDQIVGLARSLGLADRVSFTGPVASRRCVTELLDSASLFALPSRTEGLPRALIEAMARALPAVGSNIGGVPELLDPSCLVPVDDHARLARVMGRLLSDPVRWEEQSRRNLRVAQTYELSVLDEQFSAWLGRIPPARYRSPSRSRP